MLKENKLFFCFCLALILLIACNLTNTPDSPEKEPSAASVAASRSVQDPLAVAFLGDGYDLLSSPPALKGMALDIIEARRTKGESHSFNEWEEVNNSYTLDRYLNFGLEASADVNLYGIVNASGSLTNSIIQNTNFSSNTVTIMAWLKYKHCDVFINNAVISAANLNLYETDPAGFQSKFGNGYVKMAELGDCIYLVYQARMTSYEYESKDEIAAAFKLKIKDIFEGNLSIEERQKNEEKLKNTSQSSKVYATGQFIPGLIWNHETFMQVYNDYQMYLQKCIDSKNLEEFCVLSKTFAPYSDFNEPSIDPSPQYGMIRKWLQLAAKIKIIKADTDVPSIIDACENAFIKIAGQVALCRKLDPSAREPEMSEFPDIENAWLAHISETLYKIQFYGETVPYYYYISCKPTEYLNTITQLEQEKKKKSLYIGPFDNGFIYNLPVEKTLAVYQAEDPYTHLSLLLTTDIEKLNKVCQNNRYLIPAQGKVMGYISSTNTDLINNINSIPYKPTPTITPTPTRTPTPTPNMCNHIYGSWQWVTSCVQCRFCLKCGHGQCDTSACR